MIFLPSNAMLHDTEPPRAAALPSVMHEAAVTLVSRNGCAELVYGLLCYVVQSREDRIVTDDRATPLPTHIFQELRMYATGISYGAFPHTLEGSHVVSRAMDRSAL